MAQLLISDDTVTVDMSRGEKLEAAPRGELARIFTLEGNLIGHTRLFFRIMQVLTGDHGRNSLLCLM